MTREVTSAPESSLADAEAAAWIARLHGPNRSKAAEDAFRQWLNADEAHRTAFAEATDVWQRVAGAAAELDASQRVKDRVSHWRSVSIAASLFLMLLVGGFIAYRTWSHAFVTARGELKGVTLTDGTRIMLNTNSRVAVEYETEVRRVRMTRGEALFEVHTDPSRPFVVVAGDEEIRALGTTFMVRLESGSVVVTLVQGRVEVSKLQPHAASRRLAVLSPGQRLTSHEDAPVTLDTPKIEAVTAWRRGELVFDNVSLQQAAAELNRYSDIKITIPDPAVAELRISGVFATNNPAAFAADIAQIHHLQARPDGSNLSLEKSARP